MVLHLQTAVEDADHGKDCKTGTRNQRGLISNSGWRKREEHAGPREESRRQYWAAAIAI